MTLNNCASMKLEVHFQCKQVNPGKGQGLWSPGTWENPRTCICEQAPLFKEFGVSSMGVEMQGFPILQVL